MRLRPLTKHIREQNWFAVRRHLVSPKLSWVAALLCVGCTDVTSREKVEPPYITSSTPLRIVSANDGDALKSVWGSGRNLPDSISVIDLSPNTPPVTRTVSGTVPNTFGGAPLSAIVSNGQYAFIPNHPFGTDDKEEFIESQISVVDLTTPDLTVVAILPLPHHAWQVMAHPDGARVIAISDHQFHLFKMDSGQPQLIAKSEPFPRYFTSFAISPDGRSIIATAAERLDFSTPVELHHFTLEGDSIGHDTRIEIEPEVGDIDQPFAPRFSPNGKRALVLNGLGISAKPPLDAVLNIDMTIDPPKVTDMIPNVAQGLESLAFHPSNHFAVVTCIDGPYIGHLAVIDMTSPSMRLLYYLPIEFVPQGIEFSPDGSMLFVQATTANHINVYNVDGMKLIKSPYVLRTGEGPASMALITRGTK